jgi:hypothetical protein
LVALQSPVEGLYSIVAAVIEAELRIAAKAVLAAVIST